MSFFWTIPTASANSNSTFLPVIIMLGQSNDCGRASGSRLVLTQYSATVPGLKMFYRTNYNVSTIGTWQDYSIGNNSAEPDLMGQGYTIFGKEISLGTKLNQYLGREIWCIKASDGGTCLNNNPVLRDWYPGHTGECFSTAKDYIQQGIAALETANPGVPIRVVGVTWHQGESDCNVSGGIAVSPSTEYVANFVEFEAALRAIDSRISTAPIFVSNLRFYDPAIIAEEYINAQMSAYADTHQNVYYIETIVPYMRNVELPEDIKTNYPNSGLGDDDHNSHQYQIKAGELIFAKMLEIGILD